MKLYLHLHLLLTAVETLEAEEPALLGLGGSGDGLADYERENDGNQDSVDEIGAEFIHVPQQNLHVCGLLLSSHDDADVGALLGHHRLLLSFTTTNLRRHC